MKTINSALTAAVLFTKIITINIYCKCKIKIMKSFTKKVLNLSEQPTRMCKIFIIILK